VLPLFDRMLLENLQGKESQTIELLSAYLAQIIHKSSEHNLAALTQALRSVISPAIAKEIEENQDKMVDMLYPIMGGMISRYVTQAIKEMMDTINAKIEDGLSVEKYKRKLKSKLTGVSETELLFEESYDAIISSLFVVHKESGMLIAEANLEDQEIDDPHMVASMASAIKDFINDWIRNQTEENTSEVQLLSYGNATLYIESAGSVYMIAFLNADPNNEQRLEMTTFFTTIVKKYNRYFQNFDGDDSADEIVEISEKMHHFLALQSNLKSNILTTKITKERLNPLHYIWMLLGLGASIFLFSYLDNAYTGYHLEQEVYKKTKQKVTIDYSNDKIEIFGVVDKMQNFYAIQDVLRVNAPQKMLINHLAMPVEDVDKKVLKLKEDDRQLRIYIQKQQQMIAQLSQEMMDVKNELHTINTEYGIQKEQLMTLKNIFSFKYQLDTFFKDNPAYDKENSALIYRSHVGEVLPNYDTLLKIQEDFIHYITILMKEKNIYASLSSIVIEGYTDSSGNSEANQKLSKKRAYNLKEYLMALEFSKQLHLESKLDAKGLADKNLIFTNGIEDKEASRRIEIKFIIDYNKVLKRI
jgi:flagellar motor protein MotB